MERKIKKNTPATEEIDEDNVDFFSAFVEDIKEVENHMIRYHDDTFVLIAEAHPVNYYLLSNAEQEAIDIKIESWLTTLEFNTKVYIQSKFVDLTDPVRKNDRNNERCEGPYTRDSTLWARSYRQPRVLATFATSI